MSNPARIQRPGSTVANRYPESVGRKRGTGHVKPDDMTGHQRGVSTAENYLIFGAKDAVGRSQSYESLARAVATDETIICYLESLPWEKRQPNLLFGSCRYLLGRVPEIADIRDLVLDETDKLRTFMTTHRTQTNEPARCATFLPALSRLQQPLALIEVGASAGLTLLIDQYSYDYDGIHVTGSDPDAPTLTCHLRSRTPVPKAMPDVIWRRGIDLNPLDPTNDEDARWLECLVWPGEEGRQERLQLALETARRHPVQIHQGDLLADLEAVVSQAPREATVVVFHSAVLCYLNADKRAAFAKEVERLGVTWLSNEAPRVLNWLSPKTMEHDFSLIKNGHTVLANADSHGTWLEWKSNAVP